MILVNEMFEERDKVHIHIEDRGYQFGDGIYEVIRVYNGICFKLDAHLQRLQQSAKYIELKLPYSITDIKNKLLTLLNKNNLINGHIYLQVTRGVAPRTHHFPNDSSAILIAYTQKRERPIQKMQFGISAITAEDIRWHRCDIKSLNLLGNVLAKQKAKEQGCDEAILHRDSIVTEGSSTNVFIVKKQKLYTHPANNYILNGITRNVVIQLALDNNIPVMEQEFTMNDLLNADEIFITSTTIEITPIIYVDKKYISKPGEITRLLQKHFNHWIKMLGENDKEYCNKVY